MRITRVTLNLTYSLDAGFPHPGGIKMQTGNERLMSNEKVTNLQTTKAIAKNL